MRPPKTPNEHVDRVPKNDTVNMRTSRRGGPPGEPPGGPLEGQAFELSWGSAAPGRKHKGNQYYAAHDNTNRGG